MGILDLESKNLFQSPMETNDNNLTREKIAFSYD